MKVWLGLALFCLGITLAACNRQAGQPDAVDLLGTAAAEATQIIQQARATALVMEAQRQATALVGSVGQTAVPSTMPGATAILPVPSQEVGTTQTTEEQAASSPTPRGATVELISVGIGAEGLFVQVYFIAPPAIAGGWYQGNVSVTEEASGTVYNEIPVLPVVGPLFGKPVEDGQVGYVMLVNAPVPLQPGAQVTVKLGDYIFEHIQVK
jgi:hypothetical protein